MGDHSGGSRRPIDPSVLRLPAGVQETGDPVDRNPFQAGDPRHRLWMLATREAVEKVSRLKAESLQWQQTHASKSRTFPFEIPQANEEFSAHKREVICEEFQIWASRGVQVIFVDEDVKQFDVWLVGYAEAVLEFHAQHMADFGLPPHLIEAELGPIRQDLTALVFHWKGEARRFCALREEERQRRNERVTTAETASVEQRRAAEPPKGARLSRRATWLRDALDSRRWTVRELERQGGPAAKTIKRILAGQSVRENALEKLAQALSMKGRVRVSDIPAD